MMRTNNGKKEDGKKKKKKIEMEKFDVHMLNVAFMLWYVCGGLRRYVCVLFIVWRLISLQKNNLFRLKM